MGIRTPDLLHAIQWQHVHRSTSVQVTVSGRPHQSPGIQACCCTFVLTVPSFHRCKLSGPAPGRRTLDIAPDCICQPPEIAVANDLSSPATGARYRPLEKRTAGRRKPADPAHVRTLRTSKRLPVAPSGTG